MAEFSTGSDSGRYQSGIIKTMPGTAQPTHEFSRAARLLMIEERPMLRDLQYAKILRERHGAMACERIRRHGPPYHGFDIPVTI